MTTVAAALRTTTCKFWDAVDRARLETEAARLGVDEVTISAPYQDGIGTQRVVFYAGGVAVMKVTSAGWIAFPTATAPADALPYTDRAGWYYVPTSRRVGATTRTRVEEKVGTVCGECFTEVSASGACLC